METVNVALNNYQRGSFDELQSSWKTYDSALIEAARLLTSKPEEPSFCESAHLLLELHYQMRELFGGGFKQKN